jgi:putative lipoprotein (rSAM/lipoprotein system)
MKKITVICNAIIASLLGLLGFASSCEEASPAEYGTPTADFVILGKVSSSTGQPVKNISVEMHKVAGGAAGHRTDSTGTDANGNYRVKEQDFPTNQTYRLTFSDLDGAANGAFKDTSLTVDFTNPAFTGGDGNWYKGEASKEVNVQLREEE